MDIMMRIKFLYIVTMATKAEQIKWHNRRDEAYGILCLSIFRDLLFHLDGLLSPNEVWEKLKNLFGKKNKMRGH